MAVVDMWKLSIPEDIIWEILLRLPVKSLLRFRYVCKHWYALISDPTFVKLHLNRALITETKNNLMTLSNTGSDLYFVDLDLDDASSNEVVKINHPFKSPFNTTKILGSCNGLICLILHEEDVVCIWNPCTKEYKKLPKEDLVFSHDTNFLYGFGYDATIDDYKVVRIASFSDGIKDYNSEVKIYELGTNSWRRIQHIPYNFHRSLIPGVLLNGGLHWVGNRNPGSDFSRLIVSIDIGNAEYRELPYPESTIDNFDMNVGELGVLGGCLSIFSHFTDCHIDVWVMNDYGVMESWVKLFTIPQPIVITPWRWMRPICFSNNGEILIERSWTDVVLYDPNHEQIRILEIRGTARLFQVMIFVESLVSLRTGTYVGQE